MYLTNIDAPIKHSISFHWGEDVNDAPEEPGIYAWFLPNAGGMHPTLGKLFAYAFIILRHFYLLPGYSPEPKPDEHVWNWIKNHDISRKLPKNNSGLVSMVLGGHLTPLQRKTKPLRGFFHDPHLK